MSQPSPTTNGPCDQLRLRIALNIAYDEQAIAMLACAAALLREDGDPFVSELEHTIRTHRVGIMKQRALLGALGIEV